jgi:large subunit ribosomal protein L21
MYAIVRTGGKQYRVEEGQSLLVERLPVDDGGKTVLEPLLYVDGSNLVDGEGLSKVTVEARVVGHERGPKLRVVKFKPKRGYRRRTGHRQELTRIEVTGIKLGARRAASRSTKAGAEGEAKAASAAAAESKAGAASETKPAARRGGTRKPAAEKAQAPTKRSASSERKAPARRAPARKPKPTPEDGNGA